ncbi:MAG: trypsin-like peptidase domain-containing protein [Cryobacterium sp.]|nr:trypsin-like peptidase domain-containing protein [Oligoflexia bacterium]
MALRLSQRMAERQLFGLVTLSLCLLASTSCGRWNHHPNKRADKLRAENLKKSRDRAEKTVVSCEVEDCNPSIAMFVGVEEKATESCTASLVGDGIAMTNSHCIPNDLRAEGKDCRGRIFLFFPDVTGFIAERAECSEVIQTSFKEEGGDANPDYAFFRLREKPKRPVLQMSGEGFEKSAIYRVDKVDPFVEQDHLAGVLRVAKCQSAFGTFALPESNDPLSPLMTFRADAGCEIRPGNSGAPLTDASGHVRGLIQGKFEKNPASTQSVSQSALLASSLRLGSNLACLPLHAKLTSAPELAAGCSKRSDSAKLKMLETVRVKRVWEKVLEEVSAQSKDKVENDFDSVFDWKPVKTSGGAGAPGVTLAPVCIRKSSLWAARFKDRGAKAVSVKITIPYWESVEGITEDLKQKISVPEDATREVEGTIDFSPSEFRRTGKMKVSIDWASDAPVSASTSLLDQTLTACEAEEK